MTYVSSKQWYHFSTDDNDVIYGILDPRSIIHTTCSMTYKTVELIISSKLRRSTSKTDTTYFILYISSKSGKCKR